MTNNNNKETVQILKVGIEALNVAMESLKSELSLQENAINLHDITLMQLGITIGEKNHLIKGYCETVDRQNVTISIQKEIMDKHMKIIMNRDKSIREQDVHIEKQSIEIEKLRKEVSSALCRDNYWSLLESVKMTVNDLRKKNRYTMIEALKQKFKPKVCTIMIADVSP